MNNCDVKKEAYQILARFYDEIMANSKYANWNNLIMEIIREYSVPTGVCLDVACGTGKISEFLVSQGYKVIGIDKSEEMLEVARKRLPRTDFIKADIRDFNVAGKNKIVMAVSFYDSLNYLLIDEDMTKMFKSVASNLSSGAIFLFDMNTREHMVMSQKAKPKVFKGDDYCVIFKSSGKDRMWILDIDLFIKQKQGSYKLYKERHIERGYNKKDIAPLLKKAGLALLDVRCEMKICEDGNSYPNRQYFIIKK